jgi:hypothetical protein
MRTLTASDRSALIKLASSLPAGSPERKAILAGLQDWREYDFEGFARANVNPEFIASQISLEVLKPIRNQRMMEDGPEEVKAFIKEVVSKLSSIVRECADYSSSLQKEWSAMNAEKTKAERASARRR